MPPLVRLTIATVIPLMIILAGSTTAEKDGSMLPHGSCTRSREGERQQDVAGCRFRAGGALPRHPRTASFRRSHPRRTGDRAIDRPHAGLPATNETAN